MSRTRRISFTREGWCYLLVLAFVSAGAILREINVLILLAGMMAGPLVFSWMFIGGGLRRLRVTRRLPEAISVGDLLIAEIALENRHKRSSAWTIAVEDTIRRENSPPGEDLAQTSVLFSHVRPGQSEHVAYRGRLMRRGRYKFGSLRVSTRFPLGLVRRSMKVEQPARVVVCPRLGRLTKRWHAIYQDTTLGNRRVIRRWGPTDGEFHALREWRSGDSQRWIHWRTTARRGELMVREFQPRQKQDLVVLLDLWRPSQPTDAHDEAVENAVSFAATILADLCRRGDSLLLIGATGSRPFYLRGTASSAMLSEVMECLALAEAEDTDGLQELLSRSLAEANQGARGVVISTRPTELTDADRFESIDPDSTIRTRAAGMLCIDASSPSLSEYFGAEDDDER